MGWPLLWTYLQSVRVKCTPNKLPFDKKKKKMLIAKVTFFLRSIVITSSLEGTLASLTLAILIHVFFIMFNGMNGMNERYEWWNSMVWLRDFERTIITRS